ncbi:hypothetical protein A5881_001297 [Enterococcus termitis]
MKKITTTEARKDLYNIIKEVSFLQKPVEVTNKDDSVVIISKSDWLAIKESVHELQFERNVSRQAFIVFEKNGIELFEIAQINYDGTIEYYYEDVPDDIQERIQLEAKKYPNQANEQLSLIKGKWMDLEKDERAGDSYQDLGNMMMITGETGFIKEFQEDLKKLQQLVTNNVAVKLLDIEVDYWQSLKILGSYPESLDHYQSIDNVKILLRQFINRLEIIELYS